MYGYADLYMYIRGSIYIHTRIRMCICEDPYIFMRGSIYIHTRIRMCIYEDPYIFMRGSVCVYTRIHMYLCKYIQYLLFNTVFWHPIEFQTVHRRLVQGFRVVN